MANAEIKAVITAEDRASATLANFGRKAGGIGNTVKKGLKLAAVGIAAAGAAAIAFGVSSVKSYQESENAIAQLNAVLKSTRGIAKVSAKSAISLANSLQKVTRYSDEQVLSAENMLLTFTKISKDVFPDTTKAVLDMSTAMGTDLKSTAIQVGKAMQDPVRGVTALQRVGVRLSDSQKELVKNLVATGKTAEAQKIILKELQTEFGGSAEAAGKTFAGQLDILKNQFDEVKESIGKTIVDAIIPLMSKLAEFVASDQFQAWLARVNQWISVNLPLAINYVVNTLIPNLINIFNVVWPVIKTVVVWLGKFVNFLADHEWAVWAFIGVLGAMKAAFVITGVIARFRAGLAAARAAYTLTSVVLSTPIAITILVGAALIAMGLIIAKAKETMGVLDQLGVAQRNSGSSFDTSVSGLRKLAKSGTPAQKARAKKLLANPGLYNRSSDKGAGWATGGYTGRGSANDVAGIVHKGEYVLPKPMVDQNTGKPKLMGGVTNINITVPMMTGSANERRKVARMLIKDIQDIAQMNGKSVTDMMSSNYGLVT